MSTNFWEVHVLFGTQGDDTIFGGDQIDLTLAISQGATATASASKGDLLDGGSGDDIMIGTNTADLFFGSAGNDVMVGGGGNDTLYGDAGVIIYPFSPIFDWSISRTVNERIDHTEYMVTNSRNLYWVEATDVGNDNLLGGAGEDWMFGGGGDKLNGFKMTNSKQQPNKHPHSVCANDGDKSPFGRRPTTIIYGA